MDIEKVCRCCLAEECYKDLFTEYFIDGNFETYSKMLLNTFSIKISAQDSVKNLICDDCIKSLRQAAAFKSKVESSEDTLLKILQGRTEDKAEDIPLKEEYDDYEFHDRIDDNSDDNFVWDAGETAIKEQGQIFVIKLEPKNESKIIKMDKITRVNSVTSNKVVKSKKSVRTKNTERQKQEKCIRNRKLSSGEKRIRRRGATQTASETQIASRENSLNLILNSNMCLFISLKTKFRCFHCTESFMTMPELREHSKTHSDIRNLKLRFNSLRGLSYKNVDISGLACNLCSTKCDDLNSLRTHLEEKHDIVFKKGEHFLIPFKLEEGFKCVLCDQNFNTYSRMAIHMNTHYAHNVCEICGVSYINRMSLRMHINAVHSEKKCSQCSATFISNSMKVKHMKKAHNLGSYKRYCLLCDKTFRYTYMLAEHKITEHGAKRPISNCSDCGKTFLSPQNLKVHIRSVHIRERNYPCTVCGMRFFTKCDQKRHEMTHEDVKSFSCNHCDGKFKTKDSWRRHLRRQHERLYEAQ